jgi:hypothetical protein
MCNLKLNNNQVKKQVDDFGVEDDLSFDDDWITEGRGEQKNWKTD